MEDGYKPSRGRLQIVSKRPGIDLLNVHGTPIIAHPTYNSQRQNISIQNYRGRLRALATCPDERLSNLNRPQALLRPAPSVKAVISVS